MEKKRNTIIADLDIRLQSFNLRVLCSLFKCQGCVFREIIATPPVSYQQGFAW